jgi:hypothetical protein
MPRLLDCAGDGLRVAVCADNEIDRAMLEVPAAAGERGARGAGLT